MHDLCCLMLPPFRIAQARPSARTDGSNSQCSTRVLLARYMAANLFYVDAREL